MKVLIVLAVFVFVTCEEIVEKPKITIGFSKLFFDKSFTIHTDVDPCESNEKYTIRLEYYYNEKSQPQRIFTNQTRANCTFKAKPKKSLLPDSQYQISLIQSGQVLAIKKFTTPHIIPTRSESVKLINFYPSSKTIPANILYFYAKLNTSALICKSKRNRCDDLYKTISINSTDGAKKIPQNWMFLPRSIPKQDVVSYMVFPGRVKTGIKELERYAPLFSINKHYRIQINLEALEDEYNRKLTGSKTINYKISAWDTKLPKVVRYFYPKKSTDKLKVVFNEPMDFYNTRRGIKIVDKDGNPVEASIEPVDWEKTWQVIPVSGKWQYNTAYYLVLGEFVLDLAHNSLNRPFETKGNFTPKFNLPIKKNFTLKKPTP